MLKRLDSRYAPGKRTASWLKVKNLGRQEFVIGGWLPGEGRRQEHASARCCSATTTTDGEGERAAALRRQSRHRLLRSAT